MRKQTKLVAVASAAALLAIGASMTSFAATGWVEEDGEWFFYDRDGYKVEDEWKKSGDNWYWLDSEENGAMATDKLIEDGDYLYYVDGNGVMVRNTWVKMVNDEPIDDDDYAEYRYYYFQSTGKAYKGGEDTSLKTIDGKRYAFDADGKMLYGWVNGDSEMVNNEDGWKTATYYMGGADDGALKKGWQKINVYGAYGDEDDDADKWFYFDGAKGRKVANTSTDEFKTKKVNGKTYGFDETGVMVYEWNIATGNEATASNWSYFNAPEDGARVNKGWFKVIAAEEFDAKNYDDETEKWYYSQDGKLVTNCIKSIGGKKYLFNENGAMVSGLVRLIVDYDTFEIVDDSVDADELSAIKKGNGLGENETLFYFSSSDDDGSMKTGNVTVTLDGDNYAFRFLTADNDDYVKGGGETGLYKKAYYKNGLKMAASADDKYKAATISADEVVNFVTEDDLKANRTAAYTKNGEKVTYVDLTAAEYYLIGTNGSVQVKKSGVKDGSDWYFFTDNNGKIRFYANSKNFTKTDKWVPAE